MKTNKAGAFGEMNLSKDVCQKCKTAKSGKWDAKDEELWDKRFIRCESAGFIRTFVGYEGEVGDLFEWCPYKLEHMILNSN